MKLTNLPFQDKKVWDYLSRNSYVSNKYKLVYVATPKVACTSLKWWFADLEGVTEALRRYPGSAESDPDLAIHDTFHKVAPGVTGLSPSVLAGPIRSDDFFRFAVVRNPYNRIFSAWQSKLLLHEPLQIEPYLNCDFFNNPIENFSDITQAFQGFLEHIADHEVPDYFDVHWAPQVSLLRPDLISYSKITQIEDIDDLDTALQAHLGPGMSSPFSKHRVNESLMPFLPVFVTERSAELIQTLYAEDFKTFRYSIELPVAKGTFSNAQLDVTLRAVGLIRARHQRLREMRTWLTGEIGKKVVELGRAGQVWKEQQEEVANLKGTMAERNNRIANLKGTVVERDNKILQIGNELKTKENDIERAKNALLEKDDHYKKLREKYIQITSSLSWKILSRVVSLGIKVPGVLGAISAIKSFLHQRDLKKQTKIIQKSGLFDVDYYYATNPDVKIQGFDPLIHFIIHGGFEGRRPNPTFDPAYYLKTYPEAAFSGMNPLSHYILYGRKQGLLTQKTMSLSSDFDDKERYTSNQTLLFVCHEDSQKKDINQFCKHLSWFYQYTALDVRVILLGKWRETIQVDFFPTLIISEPLEMSSKEIRNKVYEFAGDNIKAFYFNDTECAIIANCFVYFDIPFLCLFDGNISNSIYLRALESLCIENDIKYKSDMISCSGLLVGEYKKRKDKNRILNVSCHVCRNATNTSGVKEKSNELLMYFREFANVKPTVSVIVPNYNHCCYLAERLDSVFGQTFKDIEVILLDDYSTDKSVSILNEYARLYPLITKTLYNEINSGSVFQQWRKGVDEAVGELLWIAESDDSCVDSFLQRMLPKMGNPKVMLAYCQSYCMGGKRDDAMTYVDMGYYDHLGRERWYHDYTNKSSHEISEFLAVYNIIPNVSSTLIRNVAIDPVLVEARQLVLAGDWFFYVKHLEGGQVSYLAQPLSYHRVHCDSVIYSNRNELLFKEFSTMHLMIANRYLLSSEMKTKMYSYVRDFVWPAFGQKQEKSFQELYDIDLLKNAEPGKGRLLIQNDYCPVETEIKPIVFYLPQFHVIPENDEWWGQGFTEWTNTKQGKPLYTGHYQPRIPHDDLGYYDLSDWSILKKQATLAKQYGVYGFCFYHYWFDGSRLLEKPVNQLLQHPEINIPFCLCWANENWTRCWDGMDSEILKAQNHSQVDDLAFIQDLSHYLRDSRYIRVDGKPLVIIYRPELFPKPIDSVKLWRKWCREHGIGEIYLAYMQGFDNPENPQEIGFDAKIEFPPLISYDEDALVTPTGLEEDFSGRTLSYPAYVKQVILQRKEQQSSYPLFRSVMMAWDNTARREKKATIFTDFSLQTYSEWLKDSVTHTRIEHPDDRRFIFINAWNEWAEGTYLEPDQRFGYGCLEAVRTAITRDSNKRVIGVQ